ncbi:hypothetical protein H8R18_08545 [Nanchangia anserum]|uniref:VIT domain-containing protein n=1 Tax=Nanchangia anserum TaxID=2692125 RepID=A0A8I0GEV5_9ACTO|nr:DUF6049 family protein [Nanchangia anserum]MBD3689562.1 hypothetical protein [Nanchangia anserum]QOX81747.1 hypothetical protein H8R18_08545 [Nanchangia anserum]
MRARLATAVLAVLLAVAALVGPASRTPAAAATEDTADPDVTITELTPATATSSSQTLSVRVTVTNPGAHELHDVSVSLDVSTLAMYQRDDIIAWQDGHSRRESSLWHLGRVGVTSLKAHANTEVTITAPLSALPAAALTRFGAHPLRVTMQAVGDDGEAVTATTQTFLLIDTGSSAYQRTPVFIVADATATAQTLTRFTTAHGAGEGILTEDFLPVHPERSPADGVDEVLSGLTQARDGMAYIVDPALISQTSPLVTGSFAVRRSADLALDPQAQDALAAANAAGATVSLGQWGAPDRGVTAASGGEDALTAARTLTQAMRDATPSMAWGPSFDIASSATPGALDPDSSVLPIVPDSAVISQRHTYIPDARSRVGNRDVLVSDSALSAALAREASTPADELRSRQYVAALLAQHNAELPNAPRLVVVTLPARALASASTPQRIDALFDTAWVRPATIGEVTDASTAREQVEAREDAAPQRNASLSSALTEASRALGRVDEVAEHASLITRPLLSQRAFALSRSLSTAQRDTLAERLTAQSLRVSTGVRTKTAPSVNIISRTADIPVQVTNDLPYPATVVVDVQAASSIVTTTATRTRIAGRSSVTVQVPVEVRANGDARAVVALRSPSGESISSTEVVVLRAHRGLEDRFLLVGAAVVVVLLVAGVIRSISRGRRMDSTSDAAREGSTRPEGSGTIAPDTTDDPSPEDEEARHDS